VTFCKQTLQLLLSLVRTFVRAGVNAVLDEFRAVVDYAERLQRGEVGVPIDEKVLESLMVNYWGLRSFRGLA